jgi:hypothetical protein
LFISGEREEVRMEAVWGGQPRGKVPAKALGKSNCGIRVYLEQFLGIRFPTTIESLYPRFFVTARGFEIKVHASLLALACSNIN